MKELIKASTLGNVELHKKIESVNFDNKPFFLWHTYFAEVFDKGGFDIVIGNPPYINLSKNKNIGAIYKDKKFTCFDSTGDIYCLFYERGWQLLKHNGRLCYITSNTWMRNGFGESMRKFLTERTNPEQLINFSGIKIFESATVNTNILMFSKDKNRQQTRACVVGNSSERDPLRPL